MDPIKARRTPARSVPRTAPKTTPPPEPAPEPVAGSATVVARLRQLIAEGHYAGGERLAEEAVAAALGVSRTPVRLAFRTLAQEGLLQSAGKRGHVVREFSAEDVRVAVEVRGVLEGLAARRLAERGVPAQVLQVLHACLAEGDDMLAGGRLTEAGIARWSALNARFHAAIVGGQGVQGAAGHGGAESDPGTSRVIADAIARNNHLPFASADSITVQKSQLAREYRKLQMAQMQHRLVVEALEQRESARVEMLMREHAYIGLRYGSLFGLAGEAAQAGAAPAAAPPTRSRTQRPPGKAAKLRARPRAGQARGIKPRA